MARIILASADDFQRTPTRDFSRSIMRTPAISGPPSCTALPGLAPRSGVHYDADNGSILEQFPTDILNKILMCMEPIWLFQLERAVPSIALYLTSYEANRIWYEVLPAALYVSPECYQRETQVIWKAQGLLQQYSYKNGAFSVTPNNGLHQQSYATLVSATNRNSRTPSKLNKGRIGLPELSNCSQLADNADHNGSLDYHHRSNVAQYPLLKIPHGSGNAYRLRNLALGGPYQPSLLYRRELLGNLASRKRCDVCMCMINPGKNTTIVADIRFCSHCVKEWTVQIRGNMDKDVVLKHVYDLLQDPVYRARKIHSVWNSRMHPGFDSLPRHLLLPFVDHVVREVIGLDYRTAKAKEAYLGRLRLLKNRDTKVMVARRNVRHRIVAAAQGHYKLAKSNKSPSATHSPIQPHAQAKYWSESLLPIDRLQEVMFAPEDLDRQALLLPMEDMDYPDDPTKSIRSCREADHILRREDLLDDMARKMLEQLLRTPNKFGKLVQIATDYHIARLRATFTVEGVRESCIAAAGNSLQNWPFRPSPQVQYTARFNTILAKLHLEPDNMTESIEASAAFKHDALKVLPKILDSACIACPASGLLARQGIKGVVEHVRTAHPRLFWGAPIDGSKEKEFKILG